MNDRASQKWTLDDALALIDRSSDYNILAEQEFTYSTEMMVNYGLLSADEVYFYHEPTEMARLIAALTATKIIKDPIGPNVVCDC